MKSLVARFVPASRSLSFRLVTASNRPATADRGANQCRRGRFLSALLGALGAMAA
jgi:hypothetical protein